MGVGLGGGGRSWGGLRWCFRFRFRFRLGGLDFGGFSICRVLEALLVEV